MMASALPRRIPTPAPSRTQATFAAQTTCPFTILRVSPNAPMSEIKRAYFLMAAQTHPDTVSPEAAEAAGGDPQAISAQFHRITAAYQLLQSQEGRHQAALQHKQAVGRAPSGSSGSWQHEERREQQEREWHEWQKWCAHEPIADCEMSCENSGRAFQQQKSGSLQFERCIS